MLTDLAAKRRQASDRFRSECHPARQGANHNECCADPPHGSLSPCSTLDCQPSTHWPKVGAYPPNPIPVTRLTKYTHPNWGGGVDAARVRRFASGIFAIRTAAVADCGVFYRVRYRFPSVAAVEKTVSPVPRSHRVVKFASMVPVGTLFSLPLAVRPRSRLGANCRLRKNFSGNF